MYEYRIDPGVGDMDEMDELFELHRDTEDYDLFHGCIDSDVCME